MPRVRVEPAAMGPEEERIDRPGSEIEEFRAVVPARAVLTDLARGFLLVHESDPGRAVRFAETFLREQKGMVGSPRAMSGRPVTLGQRWLGRLPRGAVDPPNFPPVR